MSKPLIAVTGKNGQVGWELEQIHASYANEFDFIFTDRNEIDLNDPETIRVFFQHHKPQYFINCAAYTAVDKAESDQETALRINAESVAIIAAECNEIGCTLITISTDYVFDGNGTKPYATDEHTNPINYYGYTKWLGEKLAEENNSKTIIIRTSWVYSEHGNNFVKTMLRLMKERPELKVVADQTGCPTYAADLAKTILTVVTQLQAGHKNYGIYHFSNTGIISWYEFAEAIKSLSGLNCTVLPIPSSAYPTPAKRPVYSAMELNKISEDFGINLTDWQVGLKHCIKKISAT